jgi:C-terminal processing protease CtpA/Prc
LTLNGGGDSTTASFVMSMFLGKADVCLEDTLTGAFMNESFCCDANLDGVFDDKDSLTDYRLFCLTSPCSFSCANLVPSILKNSQKVKTIGMATGGGACVVMPVALADGTIIRISGNRRLGYIKNGSVYDIDRGVEPDYPITTFDRLFDRAELTKYIRGLY